MPFLVMMVTAIGWLTAQIGGLSNALETVALEFILLGRIPGTNLFIQFEMLLAMVVISVIICAVAVVFRSPTPYSQR